MCAHPLAAGRSIKVVGCRHCAGERCDVSSRNKLPAVAEHFAHRATIEGDDRNARRHRLRRDEAKGFVPNGRDHCRPGLRDHRGQRTTGQMAFVGYTVVEEWLDIVLEIGPVLDGAYDLQPNPRDPGGSHGLAQAFGRSYSPEPEEVLGAHGCFVPIVQRNAVRHNVHVVARTPAPQLTLVVRCHGEVRGVRIAGPRHRSAHRGEGWNVLGRDDGMAAGQTPLDHRWRKRIVVHDIE